MARHLAATPHGGRATFLLEVALDRARMKARLAGILVAQRSERGGGDARRFPQPEMARLLGYSLRQYQRLEDANDPSLPSWSDLERIMGILDLDAAAIFEPYDDEQPSTLVSRDVELQELRDQISSNHDEVIKRLDALAELARTAAAVRV